MMLKLLNDLQKDMGLLLSLVVLVEDRGMFVFQLVALLRRTTVLLQLDLERAWRSLYLREFFLLNFLGRKISTILFKMCIL